MGTLTGFAFAPTQVLSATGTPSGPAMSDSEDEDADMEDVTG